MYDSWRRATSPGPYVGNHLNRSAPASAYSGPMVPVQEDSEYRQAYESATIQKKLVRTEAELAASQSELGILQRELQEARGEVMSLRTDRQHYKNRLEESSASKDVEAAGARHDRTLLIDDNRRFKEENDRMRDQLFAANHERARLEQAVSELRTELGAVNHTMVEQTETIRSLTGQMSRMGPSQMIKHQREMHSDAATISDLSRRVTDANNDRDKAVSDVVHLEDTLARLKEENARAALNERRHHEEEIEALRRRIARQNTDEESSRGADTTALKEKFAKERAMYEQQIIKLKAERDTIENQLVAAQEQARRLKETIGASKDKTAAETESLRNQLRDAHTAIAGGGASGAAFAEVLIAVEGCTGLLDRHPEEPTLSDPFVIVRDNTLNKEILRTLTAQDTLSPKYDISRNGTVARVSKRAGAAPAVRGVQQVVNAAFTAEVWSYREAPQSHEFLGCAHLSAAELLSIQEGIAVRHSVPLEAREKESDKEIAANAKRLGSITFSLQRKAAVSVGPNANVTKGDASPTGPVRPAPAPIAVPEPIKVKEEPKNVLIYVKGCNDLISRDFMGSSDPFVIVQGPDGKELKRTPTEDGTADPKWPLDKASVRIKLQREVIPEGGSPSYITFEVNDYDPMGAAEFLGIARIPVNEIIRNPGTRVVELVPRDKENDPVIQKAGKLGTITIDFSHVVGDDAGPPAEVKTASDAQVAKALKGGPQEILIHVVSCANLQDRDTIGGGSDPYVVINDPNGVEVKRTPVVDGNQNPAWDVSKASIKMVIDPKRDVGDVGFEVWDHDTTSNDFLGYAKISATEILAAESGRRTLKLGVRPKENDSWVTENKDKLGTITVDISKLGNGVQGGGEKGRVVPAPPPAKGGTYSVLCQVVQCNGLLDRDGFGAGHSDPFVVVKTSDKKEIHRTATKDGTAHPVWDEGNDDDKATCKFTFSAGDGGAITFEVFDEDNLSNDFLGLGVVPIPELIQSNFGLKFVQLQPRPDEKEGDIVKNAGQLGNITVKFTNITTGVLEPSKPADPKKPATPPPELPKDPRDVYIVVNGCRGLMDRDAIGGHSDPYVVVSGPPVTVGGNPTSIGKTPVMDNSADPTFPTKESTFRFTAYPNAKGSVAFHVWDEDTTSSDYLGYAAISIQDIWKMTRPEESKTITLGCRPDEKESYIKEHKDSLGSIQVTIKDAPPMTKAEKMAAAGANEAAIAAANNAAAAAKPKEAAVVRKVKVCVAGCDNVLDRDGLGKGDSDVFVVGYGPNRKELCRTEIISDNNTNPRWPVTDKSSFVHVASDEYEAHHYYFEVWDDDLSGSDFLGCAKLPLSVVATKGNITHTLPLQPRDDESDKEILAKKGALGTITIEIRDPDGGLGKGADAAKEQLAEQKVKEAEAAKNPVVVPVAPPKPKQVLLSCHVMGLNNILDLDGFGKGDSDATVTVFGPSGKVILQTPTIDDNLNPTWPADVATASAEVESGAGQTLTFKAEDVDMVGRDFLGEAKVSVDDALKAVNGPPMVVSLINNNEKGNAGTITLKFTV